MSWYEMAGALGSHTPSWPWPASTAAVRTRALVRATEEIGHCWASFAGNWRSSPAGRCGWTSWRCRARRTLGQKMLVRQFYVLRVI